MTSPQDPRAAELLDRSRALTRDARRVAEDVRDLYSTATEQLDFGQLYQSNPLLVLGVAAGVGYVLGGGLFTPFTGRLLKLGFRTVALPVLAAQLEQAAAPQPATRPRPRTRRQL